MRISGALEQAFNDQVTMELTAAAVYRQLAVDMAAADLPGIASWFKLQAGEELEHADKFIDHMLDRGSVPLIQNITVQGTHVTSVLEAFEASLAHEVKVSESIRSLYRQAQQEGDIDAFPLLNWFVSEQLEEEATVSEIIGRIKLIGEDGNGLLRLDDELGGRRADAAS